MFRSLRLAEAFQFLAHPNQWEWFGPMVKRRVLHFGIDGWPAFPVEELRAYQLLWLDLAGKALEKLQDGEWMARGISVASGPQPIPIDTVLWDYLRIKDRVEEAEGAGFHFIALTVTQVKPVGAMTPHAEQPALIRQLTDWIRNDAERPGPPALRAEQYAAACKAFSGSAITPNMFRNCRRAAGLKSAAVQKGRPKTKGSGN
jgi:hypothetical protein